MQQQRQRRDERHCVVIEHGRVVEHVVLARAVIVSVVLLIGARVSGSGSGSATPSAAGQKFEARAVPIDTAEEAFLTLPTAPTSRK